MSLVLESKVERYILRAERANIGLKLEKGRAGVDALNVSQFEEHGAGRW
jgi:hypothetical protein